MTTAGYYRPIVNQDGFVLYLPNVANADELIQDVPINPFAESITQQFPLGAKVMRGEEGWWYCKAAATAISIAVPLQGAAAVHGEMDDDIVVGAASAIGATTVTLTSTANLAAAPLSTKDGIKEGYLIANDQAGEGQLRKIKGHEAFSGTSNSIFTLYDPLTIAFTTSTQVGLIQHPCSNVVASKAVMTNIFTGIPEIPITASYYFWSKMAGPVAVICNATLVKGTRVVIGTTAAKVDPAADVTTEIAIGYPLTIGVTAGDEYMIVMLCGNW